MREEGERGARLDARSSKNVYKIKGQRKTVYRLAEAKRVFRIKLNIG